MARIIEDSPERVLIEDRPAIFAYAMAAMTVYAVYLVFRAMEDGNFLLGLAALFTGACGYAGFRVVVRLTRLTLHPDGHATLSTRRLQGEDWREFPPGTVRAGVQSNRMDGTVTTRPVLLIDGGEKVERLPLSPYYSGSDRAEEIVARINAWARS